MGALIGIGCFLTLTIVCIIGLSAYGYVTTFRRRRREIALLDKTEDESLCGNGQRMREMISSLAERPYEEIEIKSHDGLTLRCRYYHLRDGAPLQIQCHGYRSHPVRDFSGGGAMALESGYNLALIYQRGHGRSEGRNITFGVLESRDLHGWISYFIDRQGPDIPIALVGISMGAATVINAAAMPLPRSVKAVVADCPYSSAREIISLVASRMGFPPRLIYPFIRLGARLYGGFDPDAVSPISSARSVFAPLLLIHGEADGFVPVEMSRAIYEAARDAGRDVTLLTFPEADHGCSFLVDEPRYRREVADFLAKTVGPTAQSAQDKQ